MKTFITATMIILGLAVAGSAQTKEKMTLGFGQQKSAAHSSLRITFAAVVNDSRCPANAKCVTAGNAQIQVRVAGKRGGSKLLTFNTTMGPKGDEFEGYDISLVRLTPERFVGRRDGKIHYTAELAIVRLRR